MPRSSGEVPGLLENPVGLHPRWGSTNRSRLPSVPAMRHAMTTIGTSAETPRPCRSRDPGRDRALQRCALLGLGMCPCRNHLRDADATTRTRTAFNRRRTSSPAAPKKLETNPQPVTRHATTTRRWNAPPSPVSVRSPRKVVAKAGAGSLFCPTAAGSMQCFRQPHPGPAESLSSPRDRTNFLYRDGFSLQTRARLRRDWHPGASHMLTTS